MTMTRIAVNGACGRMGLRVVLLAHEDKHFTPIAALESASHPSIGKDIGEVAGIGNIGVTVSSTLSNDERPDAIIDFSLPEGTMNVLSLCRDRQIPLVVATTGHTAHQRAEIEAIAHHTAVLMAPNMSLAVNVLMKLATQAAQTLKGRDFDVEILERHHRFKKDSPSGTALHIAKLIQEQMHHKNLRHGREGLVGERPHDEIGVHAIRTGDNVGEHTIVFSTLGETLELTHRAHSRDCYVRGALQAARFLTGKPAGKYSMEDVLGI